jgi:hypothetical protein
MMARLIEFARHAGRGGDVMRGTALVSWVSAIPWPSPGSEILDVVGAEIARSRLSACWPGCGRAGTRKAARKAPIRKRWARRLDSSA